MKKRIVSVFLTLALLVGTFVFAIPTFAEANGSWSDNAATSFAGGDGSKERPYEIATAEQLSYLAAFVNGGKSTAGAYYVLTDNIDLGAHYWTPIGNGSHQFNGHFDGQGHEISNMSINTANEHNGLFGWVRGTSRAAGTGAELKNFALTSSTAATITAGRSCIGTVAGRLQEASVSNVSSAVKIDTAGTSGSAADIGGIVGYLAGNSIISACSYTRGVYANEFLAKVEGIGGIAGRSSWGNTIEYCMNSGAVYANTADVAGATVNAGGIVGWSTYGNTTVTGCISSGAVTATSEKAVVNAGGIVGQVDTNTLSIRESTVSADVIGKSTVGDLVCVGGAVGRANETATLEIANINVIGSKLTSQKGVGKVGGAVGSAEIKTTVKNCIFKVTTAVNELSSWHQGRQGNAGVIGFSGTTDIAIVNNICNKGSVYTLASWSGCNANVVPATVSGNKTSTDVTTALEILEGASVRTVMPTGLRWATKVNTATLNSLKESFGADKVTYGTLIAPKSYVAKANGMSFFALQGLNLTTNYLDVKSDVILENETVYVGDEPHTGSIFYGAVGNMLPENYDRQYCGLGYIRIEYDDGSFNYIYSAFDIANARSIRSVAAAVLADDGISLNDSVAAALRDIVAAE